MSGRYGENASSDAWPAGPVAAVVGEGDRLGERDVEVRGTGDADRDLRDLDRVRQSSAEVVVFGRDEHLALPRQPAPGPRVLDAVEVALEAEAQRVGLLGTGADAGADRAGRPRRERGRRLGFALLAAPQAPADVRVGTAVGPLDLDLLADDRCLPGRVGPRSPCVEGTQRV